MVVFCHVKEGDRVMVSAGKFKKVIGSVTTVRRLSSNRFAIAIDSIPKMNKKKKRSEEYIQKEIFIDSSNVLLLQVESN